MEFQILTDHWFWYVFLTIAAVGIGLFSYRISYPPVSKIWKAFLAIIRTLAIIILGIILLEPIINMFSTSTVQPKLAVLFDNSKSMETQLNDKSRLAIARSSVDSVLDKIIIPYDIFTFSSDINKISELPSVVDSVGDATSLSYAFQKFFAANDFDKYGAILLVSDGNQNLGHDPINDALKLNLPVSTYTVGEKIDELNLTIENIEFPPIAYAGDNFTINVEVKAKGIVNQRSRIELKNGGKLVAGKSFDIPEDGRIINVSLEGKIPEAGNVELTVSTPTLQEETNFFDNKRTILMRILKSKIKILLGTSELNWDYKFIKQSLESFDEFEIDAIFPEGNGRFSKPGTPNGLSGLKLYDLIILVNCGPRSLRISPDILKQYVASGGSLVYVPGFDFVTDYKSYDDLLPIEFKNPGLFESEYFLSTATLKRQHSVVMLDDNPDISDKIWESLPPISYIITGAYPFGEVLLEATSAQIRNAPQPFLVINQYEQGKVATFAGFAIWQSQFGISNDEKSRSAFPDFWRNLVRWASLNEDSGNFRILKDSDVYSLGEPVSLTGYLSDEANNPKNGALITVSVFEKDNENEIKDVILSQTDIGIYKGEITGLPSGDYTYKAYATSFEDTLGQTDGSFIIEKYSLEMSSSAPDYDLTNRIAASTGGMAYNDEDFSDFGNDLSLEEYSKEKIIRIRPFGTMLFLIILITAFCVEWGIRKKLRLP